jgi:Hyaluronidase
MESIFAFFFFFSFLRGEKITILYDPGFFPALGTNNERRNGGVPQEGNLAKHLEIYREHVNELVSQLSSM